MKVKIVFALLIGSFVFTSCRKQPCPAYGKTQTNTESRVNS
jgi:PBP1b-binding outer membrane lipoprotein LpoB